MGGSPSGDTGRDRSAIADRRGRGSPSGVAVADASGSEGAGGREPVGDPTEPEASATARRPGRARMSRGRARLDGALEPAGSPLARAPLRRRQVIRRHRPGRMSRRRIFMQLKSPFCRPYRYRGRAHRTAGLPGPRGRCATGRYEAVRQAEVTMPLGSKRYRAGHPRHPATRSARR